MVVKSDREFPEKISVRYWGEEQRISIIGRGGMVGVGYYYNDTFAAHEHKQITMYTIQNVYTKHNMNHKIYHSSKWKQKPKLQSRAHPNNRPAPCKCKISKSFPTFITSQPLVNP